ncbi:MAG: DUF5979 domain-containing protein, partial [Eubacterium sp.]|nr:DUF5979 domain-containing protein [Eubacterium sp.]
MKNFTKKGTLKARVWAILTVMVMVASLIAPGSKMSKVEAASQGYEVDINLYDYDQKTLKDPDEPLKSKKNDGPFYVVAVAHGGKNGEVWECYAVKKVDSLDSKTTTVTFDKSDFRVDNYNNHVNDYNYNNQWEWGNPQGHYDTANTYKMDTVTLYRIKDGLNDWEVNIGRKGDHSSDITLEDMLEQFDRSDAAPEDYMFDGTEVNNNRGIIKLHKSAYAATYEMRLTFEGEGGAISADDGYIAFLKVTHTSEPETYYFTDNIETSGNGAVITFPVGETDWYDQNGNPKPREKFTGKEPERIVYLVKLKDGVDRPSNADIKSMQPSQVTVLNTGDSVGRYVYNGSTPGSVKDDDAHTETYYDELKFTATPVDKSYTFLSILGESAYYGVTADSMDTQGHFESNFATNTFSGGKSNFDPDLSNDGSGPVPGTFLVGEIDKDAEVHFGGRTPATAYVVTTTDADERVVVDAEATGKVVTATTDKDKINSAVNGMIGHMQTVSSDLLTKPVTSFPGAGSEDVVIDITEYPDGAVVYVDGDKYLEAIAKAGGIHIKCKDDQLVVFNFDETENVEIGKVKVNDYDSNTVLYDWTDEKNHQADYVARHVVYNLASAKNVELKEAGGIYLLPDDKSYIDAGGTSCGWVVSAGHSHMGDGEFHYVYSGLRANGSVSLSLGKTVNGNVPDSSQVFDFSVEYFDFDDSQFVIDTVSDGEGTEVPRVVHNVNGNISFDVTRLREGTNVIKITESPNPDYETNTQEFYAVFDCVVIESGTIKIYIPGEITYYTSFDEATATPSDKVTGKAIFENVTNGGLKITKEVTGDTPATTDDFTVNVYAKDNNDNPVNGTFDITGITGQTEITFDNSGKATFTIKDGDEIFIAGLTEGTKITVEETNIPEGYDLETAADDCKVTISSTETKTVALTNKYTSNKGSLKITKKASPGSDPLGDQEFEFNVTFVGDISGATPSKGTISGQKWTFTLKQDEFATIADLPNGTEYSIVETGIDGYKNTNATEDLSGTIDTSDPNKKNIEVNILNKVVKGKLKIVKKTAGEVVVGVGAKEFKFNVTGPNGFDENYTIKLNDSDYVEIANLDLGKYRITEDLTGAQIDNFDVAASGDINKDIDVTAANETEAAVATVTNTYTRKKADLVIKKTFSGVLNEDEKNGGIEFEVYDGTTKVEKDGKSTFTISDFTEENGEYTLTFDDLDVDKTYTVKETKTTIDGYTLTKVTIDGTEVSKDAPSVDVKPTKAG